MCRPSYYDVRYEINPWMHTANRPDSRLAKTQWDQLYSTLTRELGAQVEFVEQRPDCPDMVFTANAGLVVGEKVILSRFRHAERQGEEPHFLAHFKQHGFKTIELAREFPFEGEGDALLAGNVLAVGYHKRTQLVAHHQLEKLVPFEVLSLKLTDDRWYHLDTCFLPLDKTRVVFYPGAFSKRDAAVIEDRFEAFAVRENEALRFACNSVVVRNKVAMPDSCPDITRRLERLGFEVFPIQMSEFIKGGGACKCLTLFLDNDYHASERGAA